MHWSCALPERGKVGFLIMFIATLRDADETSTRYIENHAIITLLEGRLTFAIEADRGGGLTLDNARTSPRWLLLREPFCAAPLNR